MIARPDSIFEKGAKWSNLLTSDITSGSKRAQIAKARAVLSYLAIRLKRMKAIELADFLNVSPSAISKCVLSGEKVVKEYPGIIEQITNKVKISGTSLCIHERNVEKSKALKQLSGEV